MKISRSAQNREIKIFSAFLIQKRCALRSDDHLRAARSLRVEDGSFTSEHCDRCKRVQRRATYKKISQ
jgi:hypothetical protein